MSNKPSFRKPMPKPTEVHKSLTDHADKSHTKEQVSEGIEQWHSDPADEGWDWAGPSERDQRLWKIE